MNRVAILGLGLMGGSLGLALRRIPCGAHVAGYARRPEARHNAELGGVVDSIHEDPAEAVVDADIVVMCVPILQTATLVRNVSNQLKESCIVTDVGSTKGCLATDIPPLLPHGGAVFIGSHPVAGSDGQGLKAARGDLYDGAVVVITPGDGDMPGESVERLEDFWKSMGSKILRMSPEEHDEVLARTSHLPHMISALLAVTVGRDPGCPALDVLCGAGFRDTTRLARGSPTLWSDVLETNRVLVSSELRAFRKHMDHLIDCLERRDVGAWNIVLEKARATRNRLDEQCP